MFIGSFTFSCEYMTVYIIPLKVPNLNEIVRGDWVIV